MRDFLCEQAGRQFCFGRHDCALILADWVERVTGRDPAKEYRYGYDRAGTAHLARPLAMLRLFDRLARGAGMVRTIAPELGDVALIVLPDGKPRGAIYTGTGFVTVAESGLAGIRFDVRLLAAWSFA